MTKRKTKLLALQILLFIIAVILIYLTYYKKNDSISQNLLKDDTLKQTKTTDDENFFEDVQYRGVDLNGNRYLIESETARFNSKKPDDIFMSKMVGYFYFKDGSVLRIESDNGKYNNQTQDTQFRDNIKAEHKENVLFADNIDYLNQKGLLKIYGNIKGKTGRGEIFADMVSYDLKRGSLDISMFNNNLIDVRVKER